MINYAFKFNGGGLSPLLNAYWWRRRKVTIVTNPVKTITSSIIASEGTGWGCVVVRSGSAATLKFSTEISINNKKTTLDYSGEIFNELVNYSDIRSNLSDKKGQYFRYSANKMVYIPDSSTNRISSTTVDINDKQYIVYFFSEEQLVELQTGEWEYIYSNKDDTYPHEDIQDDYIYEYLGQLSSQFARVAGGIEIVGQGLTIGFKPRFLFMVPHEIDNYNGCQFGSEAYYYIYPSNCLMKLYSGTTYSITQQPIVTVTDTSISWDTSLGLYAWVAIG